MAARAEVERRASDVALDAAIEAVRGEPGAKGGIQTVLRVTGHYLRFLMDERGERICGALEARHPWLPGLVEAYLRDERLDELERDCVLALVRWRASLPANEKSSHRLAEGSIFALGGQTVLAAFRPLRSRGIVRQGRASRRRKNVRTGRRGARSPGRLGDDDPEPDHHVVRAGGAR